MAFEGKLQSVINSFTGGLGLVLVRVFVLLALFAAFMGFYAFKQFRGLKHPEAMESAQLARNLADGRGFTTRCIRPADIGFLERHTGRSCNAAAFPDIRHAPLFPAVLGGALKLVKPSSGAEPGFSAGEAERKVIVPLGVLFTLATALLIFLAGTRLFDRRVGIVSVLVFLLTDSVLSDSVSGTSAPLIALLTTAALYAAAVAALRVSEKKPAAGWLRPCMACSVLCALAFLSRYAMVVIVPAVVFFFAVALGRTRWRAVVLFLLVFCLAVAPWLMRNRKVSGTALGMAPYAALQDTFVYEGDRFDRTVEPGLDNVRVAQALKVKLLANVGRLYHADLRTLGAGLIVCFFLVSFFRPLGRGTANQLRWGVGLLLLLLLVAAALRGPRAAVLLHAILPAVVLYGTAFFFDMLERSETLEAGLPLFLTWVLVILTAVPTALRLAGPRAGLPYPPYYPPFISYVCGLLEPGEALGTDVPWATAWYGDRASLLLPVSVDEFLELHRSRVPMNGVYLTTETGNRRYVGDLVSGDYRSWLPVLNGEVPEAFPFREGVALPPGRRDQLFLTDRIRWEPRQTGDLAESEDSEVEVQASDRGERERRSR